jgi:hypothetical protein
MNCVKCVRPVSQSRIHKFQCQVFCGLGGQRPKRIKPFPLISGRQIRLFDLLSDQGFEGVIVKLDRHYTQDRCQATVVRQEIYSGRCSCEPETFRLCIESQQPVLAQVQHIRSHDIFCMSLDQTIPLFLGDLMRITFGKGRQKLMLQGAVHFQGDSPLEGKAGVGTTNFTTAGNPRTGLTEAKEA